MLLSDAERELLLEQLKRHAAEGRLGVAELERRVAAIVEAPSREAAAAVMADLPPLPAAAPEAVKPRGRLWRGRGHAAADRTQPDWQPTAERFRDPGSDTVMRVWVDAAGGRHYVPDDAGR
ncbi:MAG: DUF1707 domain-containing protein [Solirubrobacteraceae bacterium]